MWYSIATPPKAILCTYAGGENVGCTFTHSDAVYVACGHHIDSLLWTVFLLLFFFFQQTVWTDAFFFCVEKQCSSLFLLFFFLYVRRYAGHALNLTMFCCKEMHKALCFYDLHPGFFLRKKSSFFLSFFGKLDFGGPEFTRYFWRSSALPPNRVVRFLFNPSRPPRSAFFQPFIYHSYAFSVVKWKSAQASTVRQGGGERRTMHLLPETWVSTLSVVANQVAGNFSALLNKPLFQNAMEQRTVGIARLKLFCFPLLVCCLEFGCRQKGHSPTQLQNHFEGPWRWNFSRPFRFGLDRSFCGNWRRGFAQPTNRLTIITPPASYAWSRRAQTHHRHSTALHIFWANYFVSFWGPLSVTLAFCRIDAIEDSMGQSLLSTGNFVVFVRRFLF